MHKESVLSWKFYHMNQSIREMASRIYYNFVCLWEPLQLHVHSLFPYARADRFWLFAEEITFGVFLLSIFFFAVLVVPRLFSFFSLDLLSFNHYSPEWYRLKSFEIFYTLIKMPAMNWEHFGFICDDHYYSIGMLIHIYIDILGNNHESFFCCASFWCCLFFLRWFV